MKESGSAQRDEGDYFPPFFVSRSVRHPQLATSSWQCEGTIVAAVVVLHGLAEHAGRYAHLAEYFNSHNVAVFSYDHVGHGRSEGTRLYAECAQDFVNDVEAFVDLVIEWIPAETPIFCFCHSMGGMIGALYGLGGNVSSRVAGFIFSSPAFAPGSSVGGSVLLAVTRSLSAFACLFAPKISIRAYDAREVSTLDLEQKRYSSDKLNCQAGVTAKLGNLLFTAMDHVQENQKHFRFPALLFVGRKDTIVSQQAVNDFYEHIDHPDKSLFIAENSKHEVLNDVDSAVVMSRVAQWVVERAGPFSSKNGAN